MEREISSGAMLGIVLLALAAVIGLGFGVFAIAKGVANEGTVNMQDSLGSVSDQVFLDYDQKVVTGTQAIAALNTFEGKPYAVLYGTRAVKDKTGTALTALLHTEHKGAQTFIQTDGQAFINYNAVIDEDAGFAYKNGAYEIGRLATESGSIKFDNITVGLFQPGSGEFINSSSKFNASVIKNEAGNYAGVIFKEM